MSKREDKRIADLARKNAAKIKPSRAEKSVQFDPTLRQKPPEQAEETKRLFKDMKRREF